MKAAPWDAKLFNVDQTHDWGLGIPVSSFTVKSSELKFAIDPLHITYVGRMSADRTTIVGIWTQGQPQQLQFKRATPATGWRDPSPHSVRFIKVNNNVKLEVLDWGGLGRPLVLLAGLGNTAHIFDKFALKLNTSNHVYGIPRRGYGDSSARDSACEITRNEVDCLGDDVLDIIDALNLNHPVLAGHSFGGSELSWVGSHHPEKASGLIYLEAGYGYAMPFATMTGGQKYTEIPLPILAIFAVPHIPPPAIGTNPTALTAFEAREEAVAKMFETALPSARVVRLRHADHYVFLSNEADVLREMNAFLARLPLQ